jgi:hypothetical protein
MLLRIQSALRSKTFMYFVLVAAVFALSIPTFAQTPVPLVVPTNEIFTQTNTWMGVFAPVVAIGVGIAVALAILGFIGNEILKAFK